MSEDIQLVLVPGLLCDATVFGPLIDSLSGKAKTIVPELTQQETITAMAEHALAQCKSDFALLGFSMGGRVALEMYRLAPTRIKRLALLDTGVHPLREGELQKRQDMIELAHTQGMEKLAALWLPSMLGNGNLENLALVKLLTDMVSSKTPQIHERQINALIMRPDAAPVLPQIYCPTLIGVGREDQWCPVAQHEAMQSQVANASLQIFEDAGHFALLENPTAVNAAVHSWLRV